MKKNRKGFFRMHIKERIIETTEKIYDLTRENKYTIHFSNKKITVTSNRNTATTKKWRAKNR